MILWMYISGFLLSQGFTNTHYHIAGSHVLQNASTEAWEIVCGHAVWSVGHVNIVMNVAIHLYCAQMGGTAWPTLHTLSEGDRKCWKAKKKEKNEGTS